MFKNALVYRIASWSPPDLAELEARLQAARFVEGTATQVEAVGWIEPRGEAHGPLVESVGQQWILKLCIETRGVPGPVVRSRLDEQLRRIEAETGRRPRGKHSKEIKEQIVHELLPRAFPKRSTTPVWVDPTRACVVIGTASQKRADAVAARLVEALGGGVVLRLVQTEVAPATAMAQWLRDKAGPAGFSIDRECELRHPESDQATVRYSRHMLDIDEVATHVEQGKLPTQVALTWEGRVSFVLTDALGLKKIALQDVVLESGGGADAANAGFDADVALSTGELGPLVLDLLQALGGELDRDQVAEPGARPAPMPASEPALA